MNRFSTAGDIRKRTCPIKYYRFVTETSTENDVISATGGSEFRRAQTHQSFRADSEARATVLVLT